jgi:hypothetical protein
MRHIILTSAAISLSFLAVGCSSDDNKSPQGGTSAETGPAWSVQLQSQCFANQADQCVGRYGFSVDANGDTLVGPGPKGQVVKGHLSEEEFKSLKTRLDAALATARFDGSRASNTESGYPHEADDKVLITHQNTTQTLLSNQSDEVTFATAELAEAQALHEGVRELANTYYHLPFGNDCFDAAVRVEALYGPVSECQTDLDCVYVDANRGYDVIPPSSAQNIFQDDCTAVKPLLVANKARIMGQAATLLGAIDAAQNVCGAEYYQANLGVACSYQNYTASGVPSCVKNHCQAK